MYLGAPVRNRVGEKMEIAVLGNDDFVTGFLLAGVKNVFVAESALDDKIEEALQDKNIGILVMEAESYEKLLHRTKIKLEKLVTPVVVKVLAKGQQTDIRDLIKRSVGVDLWK